MRHFRAFFCLALVVSGVCGCGGQQAPRPASKSGEPGESVELAQLLHLAANGDLDAFTRFYDPTIHVRESIRAVVVTVLVACSISACRGNHQ